MKNVLIEVKGVKASGKSLVLGLITKALKHCLKANVSPIVVSSDGNSETIGVEWEIKEQLGQPIAFLTESPDANVEKNRQMLLERSVVGLQKYGVTTERTDLTTSQWLQHILEELLDAANYVQATKMQIERDLSLVSLVRTHHIAALERAIGLREHLAKQAAQQNDIGIANFEDGDALALKELLEVLPKSSTSRLQQAEDLIRTFINKVKVGEIPSDDIYKQFQILLDGACKDVDLVNQKREQGFE